MIIWCFALKISFSHENWTQGFIVLNFLFAPTAVKLRNSQIYENYQLWCSLNYSNFFQDFVRIFEKPGKHIIRKIFYKVHGSSYICRVGKMFLQNAFIFSQIKVLLWHQYRVINCYENLRCITHSIYVYIYYIIICIFMCIELWCITTVFRISCNAIKPATKIWCYKGINNFFQTMFSSKI